MINVRHSTDTNKISVGDPGIVPGGNKINIRRPRLKRPKRRENFSAPPSPDSDAALEEDDIALLANAKRMNSSDQESEGSAPTTTHMAADGGSDGISEMDEDDDEVATGVFNMPFPGQPSSPTKDPAAATMGFGTKDGDDDFGTDDSGSEYEEEGSDIEDGGSTGTGTTGTGGTGTGESASIVSTVRSEVPKYKDVLEQKQEYLYNLEKLAEQGYHASRKYNMASNVDQMAAEVKRLKHQRDCRQSVKFQRKVLLAVVSGACLLNKKFDPIGAKLEGWDTNVAENINDYDEIFAELYEKYQTSFKAEPEIRLLLTLGGSAFFYHVNQKLFNSSSSALDSVFRDNPSLKRDLEQAALNSARANAQTPFERAAAANAQAFANQRRGAPAPSAGPAQTTQMRGPTDVDDILKSLESNSGGAPRGVNIG